LIFLATVIDLETSVPRVADDSTDLPGSLRISR
jgi:hypothetical protein